MFLLNRVQNVLGMSPTTQSNWWWIGVLALLIPLGIWGWGETTSKAWASLIVSADDRDHDASCGRGQRGAPDRRDDEAQKPLAP